jgi:hypothetical protein
MGRQPGDSPIWNSDLTSVAGGVVLAVDGETTVVRLSGQIDAEHRADLDVAALFAIVVGGAVRVEITDMTCTDATVVAFLARLLRAGRRPEVVGAGRGTTELLEGAGIRPAVDLR